MKTLPSNLNTLSVRFISNPRFWIQLSKVLLIFIVCFCTWVGAFAQNVTIPDANMKAALIAHNPVIDTSGDGEIQESEAEAITGLLNLTYKSIANASGIEAFTNITQLYIGSNQLTSLNLSGNQELLYLIVSSNQLTSIDITDLPDLVYLHMVDNSISDFQYLESHKTSIASLGYGNNPLAQAFDFTQFPNLLYMDCRESNLTSLDVSGMANMIQLNCSDNSLTNLDISNGNDFSFLYASNNNLSCIQVNDEDAIIDNLIVDDGVSFYENCANPALSFIDEALETALLAVPGLDVNTDGIVQLNEAENFASALDLSSAGIEYAAGLEAFINATSIDLSDNNLVTLILDANTALTAVDVSDNDLLHFSIANGNNGDILTFDATGNTNLACVSVDNPTTATTNWTNIPAGMGFDTDCIVDIPNTNFKNALLGHNPVIDTNDDNDIQFSEAVAFEGEIYVGYRSISDVTGIQAFINITSLDAAWNHTISTIDLSQNRKLKVLTANRNSITAIDLSKNTRLTEIELGLNSLTSIDLSANENLTKVSLYTNSLTALDLSDHVNMTELVVNDNNLSTLELAASAPYTYLAYGENPVASSFDYSIYPELGNLAIHSSGLTSVDVSMLSELHTLNVRDNDLTYLNANNGQRLSSLYAQDNPNLDCISVFEPANPTYNNLDIDPGVSLDEDCSNPTLRIPDPKFRAALLAHSPNLDLDANGKISTTEAAAFEGLLDVSGSGILSAVGIEGFTNVLAINLSNNQIKTLDLSALTSLVGIDVSNNNLTVFKFDNGDQSSIVSFNATGNENLTCITVEDVSHANSNWTNIPAGTGFSTDCIVDIPGSLFKAALLNHTPDIDLNDDSQIQTSEAFAFTGKLDFANANAINTTGLEAFTNITTIQGSNNYLTSIDVTQNTRLTELRIPGSDDITEIDLSTLQDLQKAFFNLLGLTELDLSNNTNMVRLDASKNELTSVDLGTSPFWDVISVYDNQLITLDLSGITTYSSVSATQNYNLTCIKVHNLSYASNKVYFEDGGFLSITECPPAIPDYYLRQNLFNHDPAIDTNEDGILQLSEMEGFTGHLKIVDSRINNLQGLDSFTNITGLTMTNGTHNDDFDLANYPDLTYLNIYGVLSGIDLTTNIALEEIVLRSNALTTIDLSNNVNLERLSVSYQLLTSIDLSNNPLLTYVNVEENDLITLDLTDNPLVVELIAQENALTSIDISANSALEILDVRKTHLTTLDVSNNLALKQLTTTFLRGDGISSLDLSANTALEVVECNISGLETLTFGHSPNLTDLNAGGNALATIDVSMLPNLEDLDLGATPLTTLDLRGLNKLAYLSVAETLLTSIDLSGCTNLMEVDLEKNQLTAIDLSDSPLLEEINLGDNQLSDIDFSGNPVLNYISIYDNQIVSIDLSQNPALNFIDASSNNLSACNIANGANEDINLLFLGNNPNLSCVTVDDIAYADSEFTNIDEGVSFSLSCPNFENYILNFTFSGISEDAEIDNVAHIVSAMAVAGTDVSTITPTITISENAAIDPESGEEVDFTDAVTYTVTAENSDTQAWEVTITEELAAPTDIILTSYSIDENNEVNDPVGELSASDASFNEEHTFTLATGEGDTDNASFSINEITGQLLAQEVFDRETKSNYSIRVETDDQNGGVFSRQITIEINDVNEVPSDVELDNKSVNESMPVGTVVGILSTEDVDVGDTHTYTIEEGCAECRTLGDATDNFIIVGNELRTNTIFDFETQEEYFITITSTDEGGLSFPNGYIIIINNLPAQITAVELDNASINENEDAGTLVGNLSTFGEDLSGSFTYDLVEGSGSEDNASFTISGSELLTTESFNHEVKNSYAIRVKTDDGNGYTLEQELTITIEDVSEATDTNILTFVLGEQTGEADIDIVNNTVSIEVAYGTDLTNLSPTITVSAGATISPSDVTDFSAAVTYTVTAEEPTVTEEWTVTVTEAASNETDILTFALVAQTSEATISAANHTVSIEVANGTGLTDLEPTITVSAGASISPSGAQDFSESVAYTVTAEDGSTTQSWEVTVTEAPSNATDILTFELAAQTGGTTVDASNHTIAVEVAFGTDLTSLNPTITVSAGASISPSGPQDYSSAFTYTVTAEDQTTTQEWVVTVTEAENEEVLAVADLEAKLKIYPNPASNQLQVEGLTGETAVEFFDLSGHMVLSKSMNDKGSIELADIKSGLYHVRFTNDKISTTTRLLIRR